MAATFLFAYQTHNGRYSVRAVRDGTGFSAPVRMVVTDEAGCTREVAGTEREVRAEWRRIHRANLKGRA